MVSAVVAAAGVVCSIVGTNAEVVGSALVGITGGGNDAMAEVVPVTALVVAEDVAVDVTTSELVTTTVLNVLAVAVIVVWAVEVAARVVLADAPPFAW